MNVSASVQPGRVADSLRRKRNALDGLRQDTLGRLGVESVERIRDGAPRASGHYIDSLTFSVTAAGVVAGSTDPGAASIERGRRPGRMPPPAVIAAELGVPTREAFAIARSIARKGMTGHHPIERARTQGTNEVRATAGELLRRLIAIR